MTKIQSRKQSHLDICLNQDVESGNTRLDEIYLVHKTCPELSLAEIKTDTGFLKYKIAAPIFISCMTGGTAQGARINKILAECAEFFKIPLGLGSMRILFEQKKLIKDFCVKHIAPSVPVLANLGALQLKTIDNKLILDMVEQLQADALVLHLNIAQELCQQNNETDFTRLIDHIRHFVDYSKIPIIIKEVGFGLDPNLALQLLGYGVRYIDIAGSGGTNWARVEHLQTGAKKPKPEDYDTSLYKLAYPTGLLMLALYKQNNILASGGIRSALDIARCLVLGAKAVGLALPIIKKAVQSSESLHAYIQDLLTNLKYIMLLCGVDTIQKLAETSFWLDAKLQKDLEQFCIAHNLELTIKK